MTLTVYSGFPSVAPGPLANNGLAHLQDESVKATKAFYPDDPSNVYHSYIGDHVKFRILHAGPGPRTSTTCTPTSGSTRPGAPTASTWTASSSSRARPTRWRSSTAAAATAT